MWWVHFPMREIEAYLKGQMWQQLPRQIVSDFFTVMKTAPFAKIISIPPKRIRFKICTRQNPMVSVHRNMLARRSALNPI
jgi:hypothetical protein